MNKRARRSKKSIPYFANEDEERRFWAKPDVLDYFDWDKATQPSFPSLKPSTASISLRLSVSMLEELKALANKRDVPYQSLMKVFLAERIEQERARKVS
jgi:predicted DNA binding CopG/RHH family protein